MAEKRDNDNFGTLGKNRSPRSDDSPPYTGSCQIDGKMYWISGGVRENRNDDSKFFALSFRPEGSEARHVRAGLCRGASSEMKSSAKARGNNGN
jgi:hypothetical protein